MQDNILKVRTRITEEDLAKYWKVKISTLRKWRSLGTGPAYVKVGAKIIYKKEAIEKYEQERTFLAPNERIIPQTTGGDDDEK